MVRLRVGYPSISLATSKIRVCLKRATAANVVGRERAFHIPSRDISTIRRTTWCRELPSRKVKALVLLSHALSRNAQKQSSRISCTLSS